MINEFYNVQFSSEVRNEIPELMDCPLSPNHHLTVVIAAAALQTPRLKG